MVMMARSQPICAVDDMLLLPSVYFPPVCSEAVGLIAGTFSSHAWGALP